MEICASYCPMSPSQLKEIVSRACRKLKKLQKTLKFDTIVFRGNSGACIAYPISVKTGIPVVVIRKDKTQEDTHGSPIEGNCNMVNYIILDDFICTGATIDAIYDKIHAMAWKLGYADVECVGIALYANDAARRTHTIHTTRGKDKTFPVYDI